MAGVLSCRCFSGTVVRPGNACAAPVERHWDLQPIARSADVLLATYVCSLHQQSASGMCDVQPAWS
eukprot:354470-Chlamydomonas_euryale.AAC.30